MAQSQSIPPFPENIDRRHFASWLSGFVDGEGCFDLSYQSGTKTPKPYPRFQLHMRRDDQKIVRIIQSFWNCGHVILRDHRPTPAANHQPCIAYRAYLPRDLVKILVPHFDAFPLLAKKARDYSLWREAVLLVASRPKFRGRVGRFWDKASAARYQQLFQTLKDIRVYADPPLDAPPPQPIPPPMIRPLFPLD